MSGRRIVVVGGVAAGAGAAAKARRQDEHAEIVVFEKGPHVSFANCGLPYYVGDEIETREALLLQTPESLRARFRLDVRCGHEVLAIDREHGRVEVLEAATGRRFFQPYDALILAMGGKPFVPPLPGVGSRNVRVLRTVADADALRDEVRAGARRAVVLGGGFIGLEAAENLRRRGLAVTLIEKLPQVLPPLDAELAVDLGDALSELGVELRLGSAVERFVTAGDDATAVLLEDGSLVEADLFLLSVGVRPNAELARAAGIALGPSGAVEVDERMETSVPGIFAAGDVAELRHLVTGRACWIPLAGPANKAGRVAGANAAGGRLALRGALGTSIVRVGRLTAGKTGLAEKDCARLGIDCVATYDHHGHRAGYYPGAKGITLKLVSERGSGRLLGAQAVGEAGVDKRLDVLATALHAGMRVEELEELDLAYAPPFSSAKDPVIMAAMGHANVLRGEVPSVTPEAASPLLGAAQVLDVRDPAEHERGAIAGAHRIPLPELRDRLGELDPARPTLVYCQSGQRSAFAVRVLRQRGFADARTISGGWRMLEAHARAEAAARPPRAADARPAAAP